VPLLSSPSFQRSLCACTCVSACLLSAALRAATLDQIEKAPNLTPQQFANFFRNFEFKFHSEVQPPEIFLSSQSGDCDDYSILAAQVLRKYGYTPRLIAVRMPKIIHVVCYIEESHAYLDYNLRSSAQPLVLSSGDISDVARNVAKSYGAKWSSASEFTFQQGAKRLVQTVIPSKMKQFASANQ